MPTNYTPNYQLNQWERSDKVLMEDFNADNAKIDAALRDTRPHLIRSWVTEEDADKVEFDISGIEWAHYRWVMFDIELSSSTSIYLTVNGGGTTYSATSGTHGHIAESLLATSACLMLCPVFYRDNVPMTNITFSGAGSLGSSKLPYRQLETLTLSGYGSSANTRLIRAGTKVNILGTK